MSAPKLLWVIAYDIRCKRRLVRLGRRMRKLATPVQYSVFIGRWSRSELDEVLKEIGALIEPRVDDVRAYPLPDGPWCSRLGSARSPDRWLDNLLKVPPEWFRQARAR